VEEHNARVNTEQSASAQHFHTPVLKIESLVRGYGHEVADGRLVIRSISDGGVDGRLIVRGICDCEV
jgi:hypothetical protein